MSVQGAGNHILHSTMSRRFTMSDQGRQVAKVAALVAGGAVIGAGIGLLFAPQTGAETRRDVGRYSKKAQLQATRWSRAVQSGVKEVMDRSKSLIRKDDQRPRIEAA
jgi:gas vesicle protein